jgi:hypothetical protein
VSAAKKQTAKVMKNLTAARQNVKCNFHFFFRGRSGPLRFELEKRMRLKLGFAYFLLLFSEAKRRSKSLGRKTKTSASSKSSRASL